LRLTTSIKRYDDDDDEANVSAILSSLQQPSTTDDWLLAPNFNLQVFQKWPIFLHNSASFRLFEKSFLLYMYVPSFL